MNTWDSLSRQVKDKSTGAVKSTDTRPVRDVYAQGMMAPQYSALTFPVAAGAHCIYEGELYAAKQAIAASEAWTAAHWDKVQLGAEVAKVGASVADLKSAMAQAEAALDEKAAAIHTAAGPAPIVSIPDAAAAPVDALTVGIEPVQDLHGYANPWPAGGGKNLCMHYIDRQSNNGITYAPSLEGIEIKGTATGPSYSWDNTHAGFENSLIKLSAGTYTFSSNASPGDSQIQGYIVFMGQTESGTDINNFVLTAKSLTRTVTFSENVGIYYGIYVANGITANLTVKLQIESGSTATSWAPYENICPITGWTGAKVTRTGKNLLDQSAYIFQTTTRDGLTYTVQSDGTIHATGTATSIGGPSLTNRFNLPNGTYTYLNEASQGVHCAYRGQPVSGGSSFSLPNPFTVDGTFIVYVNLYCKATGTYDLTVHPQIELGSTATSYEPYQGETYDITFPTEAGTVYGGTLDVTTGVLTVDRVSVLLNDASKWIASTSKTTPYIYSTNFSNRKKYSDSYTGLLCSAMPVNSENQNFTARWSGASSLMFGLKATSPELSIDVFKNLSSNGELAISYELATTQTYQLTPQEIRTLLGTNNIWADAGTVDVDYRADTKLYIDVKIAAAIAAALNA